MLSSILYNMQSFLFTSEKGSRGAEGSIGRSRGFTASTSFLIVQRFIYRVLSCDGNGFNVVGVNPVYVAVMEHFIHTITALLCIKTSALYLCAVLAVEKLYEVSDFKHFSMPFLAM